MMVTPHGEAHRGLGGHGATMPALGVVMMVYGVRRAGDRSTSAGKELVTGEQTESKKW